MSRDQKDSVKPISDEIEVFPAKRFFVESLTRDIDLADAILDLLDNCIDGVRRIGLPPGERYDGFGAKVSFDRSGFKIVDNCGGISLHDAINSAFRFGRPAEFSPKADGTIGVIGIGMKRAILKMGRSSVVHSNHTLDCFEVKITPDWLSRDDDWTLHFKKVEPIFESNGTSISVSDLSESVAEQFGDEGFSKKLREKISSAFALLIARGFEVEINGHKIPGKIPTLLWQDQTTDGSEIRPFTYHNIIDDVEVYLAVGFREPDQEPQNGSDTRRYYNTDSAGWTISCNDRVVLYNDKTEQTGWGTGRVPEYHTQFISISGFLEFRSKETSKLPFTTTKYGINQQSRVFLRVFDVMREGTKIFTEWTNKFKDYPEQKAEAFSAAKARSASVEEIKTISSSNPAKPDARGGITAKPHLPKPKTDRIDRTISFRKPDHEIKRVAAFLMGDEDVRAGAVGEACFDYVLSDIKS